MRGVGWSQLLLLSILKILHKDLSSFEKEGGSSQPWPINLFGDAIEIKVRKCRRQGLRRVVVSPSTKYEEGALDAAGEMMEDGRPMVQFITYDNLLDALPFIFLGE